MWVGQPGVVRSDGVVSNRFGVHMEEVQQAGDFEYPHGTGPGGVYGKLRSPFAQAMLRIDQCGDARAVDERKPGEIEHHFDGPMIHQLPEYPVQLRRRGHIQFARKDYPGSAVDSDDLGRKDFCRTAHAWPCYRAPLSS